MVIQSTLVERIKETKLLDAEWIKLTTEIRNGSKSEFNILKDGILRYLNCLCVHNDENIKRIILEEAHRSLYTIHPVSTKMYQDLRVFLVERYEEGDCEICGAMFDVLVGEGRASKTSMTIAAITDSGMEMGAHLNGFCFRSFAKHDPHQRSQCLVLGVRLPNFCLQLDPYGILIPLPSPFLFLAQTSQFRLTQTRSPLLWPPALVASSAVAGPLFPYLCLFHSLRDSVSRKSQRFTVHQSPLCPSRQLVPLSASLSCHSASLWLTVTVTVSWGLGSLPFRLLVSVSFSARFESADQHTNQGLRFAEDYLPTLVDCRSLDFLGNLASDLLCFCCLAGYISQVTVLIIYAVKQVDQELKSQLYEC